MHRFMLHNGSIVDAAARVVSPGQVGLLNGWGVFSTIRVAEGVLFAFERHFRRMERDARMMQVPFYAEPAELQRELLALVKANEVAHGTLRVAVVRNRGGLWEAPGIEQDRDTVAFTTHLNDWGQAARLGVVPHARFAASEFAGAKILSWSQNLTWYERAHQRGFDEVILLNEHGQVSECTSANVFMAIGDRVYTPPVSAGCLPGITRELLLETIHAPGFRVEEKIIGLNDLEKADEVFITSTTRELMAVGEIEGIRIQSRGEARRALQSAFSAYFAAYVEQALKEQNDSSNIGHSFVH